MAQSTFGYFTVLRSVREKKHRADVAAAQHLNAWTTYLISEILGELKSVFLGGPAQSRIAIKLIFPGRITCGFPFYLFHPARIT